MRDDRRFDRGWRGAMTIGIVVSVLAHAALLGLVRFSVEPMSGGASGHPASSGASARSRSADAGQ